MVKNAIRTSNRVYYHHLKDTNKTLKAQKPFSLISVFIEMFRSTQIYVVLVTMCFICTILTIFPRKMSKRRREVVEELELALVYFEQNSAFLNFDAFVTLGFTQGKVKL